MGGVCGWAKARADKILKIKAILCMTGTWGGEPARLYLMSPRGRRQPVEENAEVSNCVGSSIFELASISRLVSMEGNEGDTERKRQVVGGTGNIPMGDL